PLVLGVSRIAGLPGQITKRAILELLNLTRPIRRIADRRLAALGLVPCFHSRRVGPKLVAAPRIFGRFIRESHAETLDKELSQPRTSPQLSQRSDRNRIA